MQPSNLLIPNQALALLVVLAGLALVLGFRRQAIGLLTTAVLIAIVRPFGQALWMQMHVPPIVAVIVLIFVALALFRGMLSLLLGGRATAHVVGNLATDVIYALLRGLLLPFRLIRWTLTGSNNRDMRDADSERPR